MKDSAAVCSSMFSKKGEEINGEKLHKLGILSLDAVGDEHIILD